MDKTGFFCHQASRVFLCQSYAFRRSVGVYISEMRYYVHYLYFSDYCPHVCRHVYHRVSAIIRTSLLQVVGMSNLAFYFTHRGRLFQFHEPYLMDVSYLLYPVNFPSESSPLPIAGIDFTFLGYVTRSNQRLYSLCHESLRTSVYKFLGIINLMSSITIFTSAHIAISLLSLHFFTIVVEDIRFIIPRIL